MGWMTPAREHHRPLCTRLKTPHGRGFFAHVPEHKGDGVKVGCQHIGQDEL
jgi:hypothetical protein